jgi:hypothetical protein
MVATAPGARSAWGLPPVTRDRRVYILGDGAIVIARADGGVDPVVQGGVPHAGIASDPDARRRR